MNEKGLAMNWQGQAVVLIGMGHFPDTVTIKLADGKVIETYRKELK